MADKPKTNDKGQELNADGDVVIDEAVDPQAQVQHPAVAGGNIPNADLNSGATTTDESTGFLKPTYNEADFAPVKPAKAAKETSGQDKLAKLAGVKPEDVTGYSEERNTIVTSAGQKFRLAADGKTMVKLSGPPVVKE